MSNLENNIKEAFADADAKTRLPNKDAMWSRLEGTLHVQKNAVAFWRAAAILLGIFFVAGVFAGLNLRAAYKNEIAGKQYQNRLLQNKIDSLLSRPAETKTKIQLVEKVVYRDRPSQLAEAGSNLEWEEKYRNLSDSARIILTRNETQYKKELAQIQKELDEVKKELVAYRQREENQSKDKGEEPFRLKGERIELGIQENPPVKNPEIEFKIFQKNFTGNTNNLNTTLFKK